MRVKIISPAFAGGAEFLNMQINIEGLCPATAVGGGPADGVGKEVFDPLDSFGRERLALLGDFQHVLPDGQIVHLHVIFRAYLISLLSSSRFFQGSPYRVIPHNS